MAYNDNFKEIFERIKDGDQLGFYAEGLARYVVPAATGYQANHCGTPLEIKREKDKVSFRFGEQTFHGGKYGEIVIRKHSDGSYTTDNPYFVKQTNIYYRCLKVPLTEEQIKIGIADAKSQIGKSYGFASLIWGFKIWDIILPDFIKEWLGGVIRSSKRVCSTNSAILYAKMGVIKYDPEKDFFSDPSEILNLDIFEKVTDPKNMIKVG